MYLRDVWSRNNLWKGQLPVSQPHLSAFIPIPKPTLSVGKPADCFDEAPETVRNATRSTAFLFVLFCLKTLQLISKIKPNPSPLPVFVPRPNTALVNCNI